MSTISSASSTVTSTATRVLSDDPLARNIDPSFFQFQREVQQSITSTLTPLNTALLIALLTLTYYRLFKPYNSNAATLQTSAPGSNAIVFQTFTPRTLLRFNGIPSEPLNPTGKVYIAVKGKVHDVTAGRNFYGPGGPYENFAGRDATRGLACQSFDEDMLTKDLDGPLDDCADLGPEQLENLQGWVERFDEKVSPAEPHCSRTKIGMIDANEFMQYLVVGKLIAFNAKQNFGET
ncbi:Dihydrodipicolinate synthase [Neophaeococcomyces mojaviensis]|uniref:Dihydrodipicolinate synthase n=1 Tax=Neophaeococcomyces mojaviensis TaxID=3383035 RepID=A0ACC2ZS75_9EURO|nr:Dihydrodipicolinate synthase [Knufia sp. JES_112]